MFKIFIINRIVNISLNNFLIFVGIVTKIKFMKVQINVNTYVYKTIQMQTKYYIHLKNIIFQYNQSKYF